MLSFFDSCAFTLVKWTDACGHEICAVQCRYPVARCLLSVGSSESHMHSTHKHKEDAHLLLSLARVRAQAVIIALRLPTHASP